MRARIMKNLSKICRCEVEICATKFAVLLNEILAYPNLTLCRAPSGIQPYERCGGETVDELRSQLSHRERVVEGREVGWLGT